MRAKEWLTSTYDRKNPRSPSQMAEAYAAYVMQAVLPPELEAQYEDAAEKAVGAGALRTLKNAEAAIGRWFMEQRAKEAKR